MSTEGDGDYIQVVVLARADSPEAAEYCAHGFTECVRCGHSVQLGSTSWAKVAAGAMRPVCLPCAQETAEILNTGQHLGMVDDH